MRKREEMEIDDGNNDALNKNGGKEREIITIDDDTENEDVEAMNIDSSPKRKRFKKSFGRKTTEYGKKGKIVSKSMAKKKRSESPSKSSNNSPKSNKRKTKKNK